MPIYEDDLERVVKKNVKAGRLHSPIRSKKACTTAATATNPCS